MAKLNDVRALAKETAEKVSRSPQGGRSIWTQRRDCIGIRFLTAC